MVKLFHSNIAIMQFFENGINHIPLIDSSIPMSDHDGSIQSEFDHCRNFTMFLYKDYKDEVEYSPSPRFGVDGYIYSGERFKRSPGTEEEFKKWEEYYGYEPGEIKEIWRYYILVSKQGMKTWKEYPSGKVIYEIEESIQKQETSIAP